MSHIMQSQGAVRILVTDDENIILKVYERCFRNINEPDKSLAKISSLENELFGGEKQELVHDKKFDVTYCKQGHEAVEEVKKSIAENNPFAMAFLDIRMPPGIDGVQTAEQIRAIDPYINIVFVTAYSDISPEEINRRVPPAENLLYVQKPMHIHEIRQFSASLSAKWLFERAFRDLNRQLAGKLHSKTESLNATTVELTMEKIGHVKAEADAEESKRRFYNVVHSSPMAIHLYVLDSMWELKLVKANASADDLFAVKHEELIGTTIDELLPDIVEKKLKKKIQIVGKRGKAIQIEEVFNIRGGEERTLEIDIFQTSPRNIALMFNDITERKKAESQLKESKEHLSLITNQLPAMIAHTSTDLKYLFTNNAYARFYGQSPYGITGMSVEEVIGKRAYQDALLSIQKVLSGETVTYEKHTVDKSGNSYVLSIILTPDIDKDGLVRGYFSLLQDITEQKQSEKERQDLREQLLQSQKMEAIGNLAGGIAHDFNNLLAGISGCAYLAMDEAGIEEQELLDEIVSITKRGSDLTKKLLAFSRKQIIVLQEIDTTEFMLETCTLLERLIGRGVKLKTDFAEMLPKIKVDPGHLTQVMMNLAVNARDAMENDGKLTIETSKVHLDEDYCRHIPDMESGEYVMVAVSDNGSGIDPEIQEKIFEPFFTTKTKDKGTGLGLSTVYGIVKQNKGIIDMFSEVGMGTTFKIYFPAIMTNDLDQINDKEPVTEKTKTKVLVVDDEEIVRSMTVKLIKKLGYEALDASCGNEAIDVMERINGEIDILLTDVVMPEMNGKQLADTLLNEYPNLKVIYTSGYTTNAIMRNGILTEDVVYIPKPYSARSLNVMIKKIMGDDEV